MSVASVVTSAREDTWEIAFDDGFVMYCAKTRDDMRIDTMLTDGDDEQKARMQAMIAAVREHEAQQ